MKIEVNKLGENNGRGVNVSGALDIFTEARFKDFLEQARDGAGCYENHWTIAARKSIEENKNQLPHLRNEDAIKECLSEIASSMDFERLAADAESAMILASFFVNMALSAGLFNKEQAEKLLGRFVAGAVKVAANTEKVLGLSPGSIALHPVAAGLKQAGAGDLPEKMIKSEVLREAAPAPAQESPRDVGPDYYAMLKKQAGL